MEQAAKKRVPTAAQVLAKQKADHAPGGFEAKSQLARVDAMIVPAAPEHAEVFAAYANAVSPRNIIGKLLKFSKGDYVAGEGGEEVKEGTKFVAIMDELSTGWVRWEDNKPVEHRTGRVVDKFVPPPRRELGHDNKDDWPADDRGEARDPWQFTNYLVLKSTDDTGEFYTFTTGTRGGLNAIADLCRHYARDVKQHPDCFPVIALKVSSYDHPVKSFGRVKVPVLTVVGRAPRDGVQMPVAADMDDEIPF